MEGTKALNMKLLNQPIRQSCMGIRYLWLYLVKYQSKPTKILVNGLEQNKKRSYPQWLNGLMHNK